MAAMVGSIVKTVIGVNAYNVLEESKLWCQEGSRSRGSEWKGKCNLARQELAGCNRMMIVVALVSVCVSTLLGGLLSSLLALGSVVGLTLIEDSQDLARKVKGLHAGTEKDLANNLYAAKGVEERVAILTADCLLLNKVGAEFLLNMATFVGMGSLEKSKGMTFGSLSSLLSAVQSVA